MPGVSVIIPAFNRADLLTKAVESVLRQTVRDFEIIVVDDGSNPPLSAARLPDDPRLRIIRLDENRKAANARNIGMNSASGEWIAFLDSDDTWRPEKLERQLALAATIEPDNLCAIATGWTYIGDEHPTISLIPREADRIEEFSAGSWFCPGSTVVMRRADALRIGLQDVTLKRLEDYDWFLRFSLMGGTLRVVPEPLAAIRWHRSLDSEAVREASALIERKFCRPESAFFITAAAARRRVQGFLALAVASAAWYNQRRLTALAALASSWFRWPRLRPQLADWWTKTSNP